MTTTAPPAPLLNTRQAAEFLNLSPTSLVTLRCRGGGPEFVRLGRAVRYRMADLEAWVEAGHSSKNGTNGGASSAAKNTKPSPMAR